MSRRGYAAAVVALIASAALCLAPSASASLGKGFWGPTHQPNGMSAFPIYRDLGVTIYQSQLRWNAIAPSRPAHPRNPGDPAYRWPSDIDYAIREAGKYRMRVLLMIQFAPSWANGHKEARWVPKRPSYFGDFAYAASKRYPGVHLWMIWGEPSRVANFQPETPENGSEALTKKQARAPHLYAGILDAAYGQLKKQSKKNLVIGGDTFSGGSIRPVRWVQNMKLPNGKRPRLDMYGHNPFTNRKPNLKNRPWCEACADFSDLRRFGKTVDRVYHRHVPLFLSEWTIPSAPQDSEFNAYAPRHPSEATQADWITAGFHVARSVNAYALGWIHLYDETPNPYVRTSHGGLLTFTGLKKKGYGAYKKG